MGQDGSSPGFLCLGFLFVNDYSPGEAIPTGRGLFSGAGSPRFGSRGFSQGPRVHGGGAWASLLWAGKGS